MQQRSSWKCWVLPMLAWGVPLIAGSEIEDQLKEIGSVPNEEVFVVQRKYTRKNLRSEFVPITFGAVPFGTVRTHLFGGAAYALHLNDSWAWEVGNFLYSKTFLTSFVNDINAGQDSSGNPRIGDNTKKLLFLLTTGLQWTPFYGKMSTMSRWIAYLEPYISVGTGVAHTEGGDYLAFYPGVGFRVFFREWFSMRLEFRDYMYFGQVTNLTTGAAETRLIPNYAFTFSICFWLPKMPSR